MWQCLPVKKDIVRIAHFSFLVTLITCSTSGAYAQSNIGINTVVDVKEDRAKGSATIVTAGKKPLPRPIIQFLQGENGNTVLVADFEEVVFPFSTKVISVHSTPLAYSATTSSAQRDGIKLVRIGRFQDSPPICRVAIISSDPAKLRAVTFDSRPGALSIRWPKSSSAPSAHVPPLAPSFKNQPVPPHRRAYQTTFTPPPVTPPTGALDPGTIEIPQVAQPYQTRIDPEVAAANYGQLRPAMQEPTIASRPNHALNYDQKLASRAVTPEKIIATSNSGLVAKAHSLPNANSQKAPPVAPSIASSLAKTPNTGSTNPPKPAAKAAPVEEQSATGFSSLLAKVKDKTKNLLAPENPDQVEDLKEAPKKKPISNIDDLSQKKVDEDNKGAPNNGTESQASPIDTSQPPTVALEQNATRGYTIKIVSPDKSDLNFTSFRLHNPERFVIDFQNLRDMQAAAVPQPDNLDHLKAIRVGAPDPLKNTGRLVLDLADENVSVIPGETNSVNEVSFVIGETSNPLIGLTPPPGSVLVLDAGHGGTDPGAQRGFVKEKDLTMAIAEKTRKKLTESGIKVVMTRSDDTFISLADRVAITNTTKPDVFLSIHINSLESTSDIHGIETYYQTDMSKALAQSVHESLVSELDAPNRSVRKAKFYVVNRAEVPAVLAEVGFISNKTERDKLVAEDYQEKIAGALAKGAILYLKQHSAVAGKVSRASESNDDDEGSRPESKSNESSQVGSTIPRAKSLVHKGLGIKSE